MMVEYFLLVGGFHMDIQLKNLIIIQNKKGREKHTRKLI
jgi:hypothetical protein